MEHAYNMNGLRETHKRQMKIFFQHPTLKMQGGHVVSILGHQIGTYQAGNKHVCKSRVFYLGVEDVFFTSRNLASSVSSGKLSCFKRAFIKTSP